ncbi:hypothetical protein D3C76_1695000 [compost metagenome]
MQCRGRFRRLQCAVGVVLHAVEQQHAAWIDAIGFQHLVHQRLYAAKPIELLNFRRLRYRLANRRLWLLDRRRYRLNRHRRLRLLRFRRTR